MTKINVGRLLYDLAFHVDGEPTPRGLKVFEVAWKLQEIVELRTKEPMTSEMRVDIQMSVGSASITIGDVLVWDSETWIETGDRQIDEDQELCVKGCLLVHAKHIIDISALSLHPAWKFGL